MCKSHHFFHELFLLYLLLSFLLFLLLDLLVFVPLSLSVFVSIPVSRPTQTGRLYILVARGM